jgi:DNA-binding CsgD family transcriptional regulator/PAS domain-containing protein
MRHELNFANAALGVDEMPSGKILIHEASGISPAWFAEHPKYASSIPAVWGGPLRISQFPSDEPILATDLTPPEVYEANAYVAHWARPQGLVDCVALFLTQQDGLLASIAFGVHEDSPATPAKLSALRLAVAISKLLDMKGLAADTLQSALDSLVPAIVLVDADLGVVHANSAARAMLRDNDPILESAGKLALPHPRTTAALADAVKRAGENGVALGQRGIGIPAKRRDGSPAVAHVMPLRQAHRPSGLAQRAVAAVFVASAAAPPQMSAAALALLYDLTPAETRVLELIVEGKTREEIAAQLGVSLATTKTHLQRVFDKTGHSRQADLLRLVGSLALPV